MNINIDRTTGKVTLSPSPLTYSFTVLEDFSLSKVIEVQEGEKQKTNEQGELLFYNKSGEEVTTPTITIKGTPKAEIPYDDSEVLEYFEPKKEEIVEDKVIKLEPVMIPNMVKKTITFKNQPTEFTVDEIVKKKYQDLLEQSDKDYILADMFLNEEDLDLSDPNHAANTGVAIVQLLPKGQAKTKTITLESPTISFELLEFNVDLGIDIYLNDQKFVDGKVLLTDPVDTCTIKFINTTASFKEIKSYAIGY